MKLVISRILNLRASVELSQIPSFSVTKRREREEAEGMNESSV
jgi:hypothetical protein